MIILFILDLLIYNITSFNIPLYLVGLPYVKNLNVVIVFFLILIFFKWQYIFILLLSIILYFLDGFIYKSLYIKYSKILCIIANYIVYFVIYSIIKLC